MGFQYDRSGPSCDECIPLPGCEHGSCNEAFECNCDQDETGIPLWEGSQCDKRIKISYNYFFYLNVAIKLASCPLAICDPNHGQCHEPSKCSCDPGWAGEDCKICQPLTGCLNGQCQDQHPGTCQCSEGWNGHLCDQPICRYCFHIYHLQSSTKNTRLSLSMHSPECKENNGICVEVSKDHVSYLN